MVMYILPKRKGQKNMRLKRTETYRICGKDGWRLIREKDTEKKRAFCGGYQTVKEYTFKRRDNGNLSYITVDDYDLDAGKVTAVRTK